MKRYAAVKVPPEGFSAPWEPDAADGGRGRAPSWDSAPSGPSLSVFSLQAGSLVGSTGRALNVSP